MQRDAAAGGNVPAHSGRGAGAPRARGRADRAAAGSRTGPGCPRATSTRHGSGRCASGCGRCRLRARCAGSSSPTAPTSWRRPPISSTGRSIGRIPVAITGAMRTSSDEGWDGPRNLRDAVTVAASASSAGRGTMVVFAGQVFAGRTAAKTHATDLDAFSAPHGGPIGRVVDGEVTYAAEPTPRSGPLEPASLHARVALVPMVVGDEGTMLDLARGRSRRRGGRGVRQREHAARRGARHSALDRGGEAGGAGQPLLVGTGDAGLRVRGRRRAHRGDGRDPRGAAHAVAGTDGAGHRALGRRAVRVGDELPRVACRMPEEVAGDRPRARGARATRRGASAARCGTPCSAILTPTSTSPPRRRPEEVQRLFRRTAPIGVEHGTVGVLDRTRVMHEVTTFRRDVAHRRAPRGGGVRRVARGGPRPPRLHHQRHRLPSAAAASGAIRYGGERDLEAGVMRAVGDPAARFREDYLRILRAIRFAARFGFAIDPATWDGRARRLPAGSPGSRPSGCETSGSRACARRRTCGRWCGSGTSRVPRRSGCPSCATISRRGPRRRSARRPPRDPVLLTALLRERPGRSAPPAAQLQRGDRHGRRRWRADPGSRRAPDEIAVRRWLATVGGAADDLVALYRLRHGADAALARCRGARSGSAAIRWPAGDLAVSGRDLQALGISGPRGR